MKRLLTLAGILCAALCMGQASRPLYVPDRAKTPGATLDVTKQDVCTPLYTKKVRNVPASVKRQVFISYGIDPKQSGKYEVDHDISLELGGSNSVKNLWPELYDLNVDGYQMGAREKDKVETKLHRLVCSDKITLADAQKAIAGDWTTAYKKYVHPQFPKYVVAK